MKKVGREPSGVNALYSRQNSDKERLDRGRSLLGEAQGAIDRAVSLPASMADSDPGRPHPGYDLGHDQQVNLSTRPVSVMPAPPGLTPQSYGEPDTDPAASQLISAAPMPSPQLLPPPAREGLRVYDNRYDPIPRYDSRALQGYD